MAEVVISYSREDQDRIALIAGQLEAIGVDVWFDRKIPPGRSFDEFILEEIRKSQVVLVCWSPLAVASKWVKAEATEADDKNIYLPIKIAECKIGLPFNRLQTEDFSHWDGDPQDPVWLKIVDRIAQMVGRESIGAAARAFGSGEEEDWYVFAKKFPDDPTAQRIWREAEQRLRTQFAERLVAAKQSVADRIESERAAFESALVFLSGDFESWLAAERRGGATGGCPNPLDLADAKSKKETQELREQVSALSRLLSGEQEKVERLSGAQVESVRLAGELDEARDRLKKAKQPMRTIGRALLVGLVGVAAGVAGDRLTSDPSSEQAEIVELRAKIAANSRIREDIERKLKFSTERISEQGLQIGVLKSENNSLKHADIESAKSIEELKNALAASSGQIANARQESKKNFDDLEKRVVSLVTKCNGKSIFVDTFSVIKDIWSKLNGIKTGENGLIIENDRDTNIFRIVTSEKIKAISRICAAFRLDKDAVDRDKFSEFGIIFNDRGISYNVFYIDISRKYSYYYNVNFNEITGRFVWSQMSQASLGDKNIIPNKIYNVKISYENNNIDFYIDDIKLLSTQIFAIGSGQMLGGAGLYFRATGAARVEVPAFGIFD